MRLHEEAFARVDAWAKLQPDEVSLPEAIRRLIELGLKAAEAEAAPKKKGTGSAD